GAFLYGAGDFSHPLVAVGLPQQPDRQSDSVADRHTRADECEQHRMVVEKAPDDQRSYPLTKSAPSDLGAGRFLSHGAAARAAPWLRKRLRPCPADGRARAERACRGRPSFPSVGLVAAPRRVGVRELEIRRDLLEVAYQLVADRTFENRQERTERFYRQPRLLEVAMLLGETPVAERRDGVQRLDEEVGDLELLELGLELPDELLVRRLLRISHPRAPAGGAPTRRRRRGASRARRASRTDARRRSTRGRRGTVRRRSP